MTYQGTHISGQGNPAYLQLIDKSFGALRSSPTLPNLKMLYKSATDMFSEGFIWGTGWWIQNSYGFTMGAIPLLDGFWSHILQNSYDAFWQRIGDGKRIGADNGQPTHVNYSFCAPDGSLGDCVLKDGIIYRQGDGDVNAYDWFYEATAAGVHMQADILLFDRRPEKIQRYLPLMWRSLNHIESARAENGLFLVGAAANLLAPSYGGSCNRETGEVVKGYLTGLSVTYSAALKKCAELCKMVADEQGEAECRARLARNLAALPQLLTEEGYFAKSMDPDGTLHGVYGADRYGYMESVCNVDAIAWDVVGPEVARSIYQKIASVPNLRGAGILCNNYPHLDDTLPSYRQKINTPTFPRLALGRLGGRRLLGHRGRPRHFGLSEAGPVGGRLQGRRRLHALGRGIPPGRALLPVGAQHQQSLATGKRRAHRLRPSRSRDGGQFRPHHLPPSRPVRLHRQCRGAVHHPPRPEGHH